MDALFKKPSRIIYAGHQVVSCKQPDDECITVLLQRLLTFVGNFEFTNLNLQQHKDISHRDDLLSGRESNAIRVRHLELADSEASHENLIWLANAIQVSSDCSRAFNASSDTPPSTPSAPVGNIAAVNKRTAQTYKAWNRKCGFCGLQEHPRTDWLARRCTCLKCTRWKYRCCQ